ncbi:XdhC family protein [Paracoccus yeei]|uniref:XdhC family protein n=1 Tax=Paracoccus yeei TaxID=147645 RepID=UPI001C8E6FDB|nr:XdhC family protein [Paracoccus yeei]MBY0136681.1 XdhC family protein [Paracoccus yeei]
MFDHSRRPVPDRSGTVQKVPQSDLPLDRWRPGAALAVIAGTQGPAYRLAGAGMVIEPDGTLHGQLSAGCIDRDVALHAAQALADGQPRRLRYGAGSPFRDLQLPCGGTLDILVEPRPDPAAVARARADLAARRMAELPLGPLQLRIRPALRCLTFGSGPEARLFADLVHATGWRTELYAPDPDTLAGCGFPHGSCLHGWPEGVASDPHSAVVLFFHDHDREIAVLEHALARPAFYIGAMGSLRAAGNRLAALQARGVPPENLARLRDRIGLIPSVRDPRSLAVSVLADVAAAAAPA